jgi:predicted amidophosphoribosyltransferase
MKLANCPRCRRPFINQGRNLCPVCIEEEDKAFDTIRDYLDQNPGAGLYQICVNTGIDEGVVISLIQRGKLRSVERRLTHQCARCGTEVLIVDGDFCDRCQRELQSKVSKAIRELSSKIEPLDEPDRRAAGAGKQGGTRDTRMFIRDIHRKKEETD